MNTSSPLAPRSGTGPIDVLRAFTGLRRNLSLYPPGHRIIDRSVTELAGAVQRTAPDSNGVLHVQLLSGVAHLEGYPHRADSRAHADLIEEWRASGVECLEIAADAPAAELLASARVANELAAGKLSAGSAREALDAAGVEDVRMTRLASLEATLPAFDWADAPASVAPGPYADVIEAAKETVGSAFEGGELSAEGIGSLLAMVTGELVDDGAALAEILAVKRYESHTFRHSIHVAALAILLARRIGLDAESIRTLGEAALLHDIGKRQVPVEMLRKPGPLTRRERRVVERHTVFGAEILALTPGLGDLAATVALEHHRHFVGGGYPDLGDRIPHEASQIIGVVDIYEALTGARPYREPLTPDEACLVLARLAGNQLNPALVRAFVSLISFFPIGSVVRTTLDEVGVVIRTHEDDPLHPEIEALTPAGFEPTGTRIDLSDRDADGAYRRHVAETVRHGVVRADFVAPSAA